MSHCLHPPTNPTSAGEGAGNVHLFTALGSRAPMLRRPTSPKIQTDSLLGVHIFLTSHVWSLNLENGDRSGATLHHHKNVSKK